jgi:hypothetical protein
MKLENVKTKKELESVPHDLKFIGELMSNFDHKIKNNAEGILKNDRVCGQYPAWNFFGLLWYAENKFKCHIAQYHQHINTIEGDTLQEIMEKASDLYGEK